MDSTARTGIDRWPARYVWRFGLVHEQWLGGAEVTVTLGEHRPEK